MTLLAICGFLVAVAGARLREGAPFIAGILLYLVYIVRIGGDFMSGRFLRPRCSVRLRGLLRTSRELPLPHNAEVVWGREARATPGGVVVHANVGLFGYLAGPTVHIVDPMALTDPLLARLPAEPKWRIGHFERKVPDGYVETLQTGNNVIADPAVGKLYERLRLITRDSVWSRRRWRAILLLNLGW